MNKEIFITTLDRVNLSRYSHIMDAMKHLPFKYIIVFSDLEKAGKDSLDAIKQCVIGSDALHNHIYAVVKDNIHIIKEEDVRNCKAMLDIELEMFLNPDTQIRNIMSIINTFNDSYTKIKWRPNGITLATMRFYFGYGK